MIWPIQLDLFLQQMHNSEHMKLHLLWKVTYSSVEWWKQQKFTEKRDDPQNLWESHKTLSKLHRAQHYRTMRVGHQKRQSHVMRTDKRQQTQNMHL